MKKIRTKIKNIKWNKILKDKIKINAKDKKNTIKRIKIKLDTKIK